MVQDPRLRQILASRAGMSAAEIEAMPERAGWQWVYGHHRLKRPGRLPDICFTGFTDEERGPLELQAQTHFRVIYSVTKNCCALCVGAHPGPAKLERAEALCIPVLSGEQIYDLLEQGEMPHPPAEPVKPKRRVRIKARAAAEPAPPVMTLADAHHGESPHGFWQRVFGGAEK